MISEIEAYLLHLRQAGRARATQQIRLLVLRDLSEWLKDQGVSSWQEVAESHLRSYVCHLLWDAGPTGRFRGAWTRHSFLTTVRLFFRYLQEEGRLLWNPAQTVSAPVGSRLPKAVLSFGEMEALLLVPNLQSPIGIRDRAALEVLYATGIRAGELLSLTCADCDLKDGLLSILKGKGQKSRLVPLGEEASQWLSRYLSDARPRLLRAEDTGALWISERGTALEGPALRERLKHYIRITGLPKRLTLHGFRHTCAVHLLCGGADIRYIQELLGHADVTTTQIYLYRSQADLAEVLKKSHPRRKLHP